VKANCWVEIWGRVGPMDDSCNQGSHGLMDIIRSGWEGF
jgi:hypothetical protein